MSEFVIPLALEDLSTSTSTNQYYVKNIIDVNSISTHVNVVNSKLPELGPEGISKYFDYFYGVLFHWSRVDVKIKDKIWNLLINICQQWPGRVVGIESNDEYQFRYRNCIKMTVYLIYKLIELYEAQIQQNNVIIDKSKGRKKKPQCSTGITNNNWADEVVDAVNALSQLTKAPIEKLWTPPVVENDFVNLLSNCCYKLMENPDHCKNTSARSAFVEILIKLNKYHNHTNDCSIKLGQLLQSHIHFVPTLQYICTKFLEQNMNMVVREILREICSYSGSDLEHNSQASSHFASFLSEFGSQNPNEIVALLPVLIDKLQEEPHGMRNAVLSILGEVIIHVYHDDQHNRDSILDVIEQHIFESNAFVRAKALSVLVTIVEQNQGMTLDRKNSLMKNLIGENGAIFDSSATVRKFAIKMLTCFVQQNMAKGLSENDLVEDLKIAKLAHEEAQAKFDELLNQSENDFLKHKIEELETHDDDMESAANKAIETFEGKKRELEKQVEINKGTLVILEQTIEYTKLLNHAVKDMAFMLNSKTVTDVLEAISFFVDSKINKMPNVDLGVRKMLLHISSKEEIIKSAVADAYKRLYLCVDEDDDMDGGVGSGGGDDEIKNVAVKIVNRLCGLIGNANYGELISLEMLIGHFAKKGEITENVVECLWRRCMSHNTQIPMKVRRHAAVVFSMVAQNDMSFMKNYFNYFIQQPLNYDWLKTLDHYHVAYLCQSIQNLMINQYKSKTEPFRLNCDHSLFKNMSDLCVETFVNKKKPNWTFMTQEIINMIYQISENPDQIMSKLIHRLALSTFQVDKENLDANTTLTNTQTPTQKTSQHTQSIANITMDTDLLTRFMSAAGHVIIKQFTHFEVSILNELKRRNQIQDAMKDEAAAQQGAQKKDGKKKKTRPNASVSSMSANNKDETQQNLEEEMGLVGATADDAEAEFIRRICDQELVSDPSKLFNRIVKLAAWVCRKGPAGSSQGNANASGLRNPALQTQAVLTLAKSMVVSEPTCLLYVDLLFSVAERSPSTSLRANLLAAFGDLVRRFPHVLEPYTPRLYARLTDEAIGVRTSALNVISHLVLNDMVKVKGQISEMTKCLVDSDTRIVHLSRVFFQELANKDKALYNVMPDIISNLSNSQIGVDEKSFHTIMEFLMPFIQKKNLNENLFEKICARFDPSGEERSWKNMAYCLSLLQYNENMIETLQFKLNMFAPMLHVTEVYDALSNVLVSARKSIKQEKQEQLDEIARKLEELRDKGMEDEEVKMNAERAAAQKKPHHHRTNHRNSTIISSGGTTESKKTSPKKKKQHSGAGGELFSSEEDGGAAGDGGGLTPVRRSVRSHIITESLRDDNEDNESNNHEGEEVSRSRRNVRSRAAINESSRSTRNNRRMQIDEDSNDDD